MAEYSFPHVGLDGSDLLQETGLFEIPLHRVLGCDIRNVTDAGQDIIMLLGRDILRDLVMVYDGPRSNVTIRR